MKLFDINPYVRFARVFEKPVSRREIVGVDNRLFFCTGGEGEITVAGKKYALSESSALLIRAGTPYKNTSASDGMKLYAFNFDFLYNEQSPKNAVSYVATDLYRENMLLEPRVNIDGVEGDSILVRGFFHKDKLETIIAEQDAKGKYSAELSAAVFKELLVLFARESSGGVRRDKGAFVLEYIREHYREPLTNESVAVHFSYHKNYINSLIKKETGTTLHSYLLNYRIERAAELIASGEYSISEAGEAVGFSESTHFSRAFKKITGRSPNNYMPKRKG